MTIPDILKELSVNASQETCYRVFTENMDGWWPRDYHVGKTPPTKFILEPGVNGRWYSTHEDGTEINIGYVLVWQPNERLVLNWKVGGDYKYHEEINTEVELIFVPLGETSTRVQMAHRNLDRLSGGEKNIPEMDGGWGYIMSLYKQVAENKKNEDEKSGNIS